MSLERGDLIINSELSIGFRRIPDMFRKVNNKKENLSIDIDIRGGGPGLHGVKNEHGIPHARIIHSGKIIAEIYIPQHDWDGKTFTYKYGLLDHHTSKELITWITMNDGCARMGECWNLMNIDNSNAQQYIF